MASTAAPVCSDLGFLSDFLQTAHKVNPANLKTTANCAKFIELYQKLMKLPSMKDVKCDPLHEL